MAGPSKWIPPSRICDGGDELPDIGVAFDGARDAGALVKSLREGARQTGGEAAENAAAFLMAAACVSLNGGPNPLIGLATPHSDAIRAALECIVETLSPGEPLRILNLDPLKEPDAGVSPLNDGPLGLLVIEAFSDGSELNGVLRAAAGEIASKGYLILGAAENDHVRGEGFVDCAAVGHRYQYICRGYGLTLLRKNSKAESGMADNLHTTEEVLVNSNAYETRPERLSRLTFGVSLLQEILRGEMGRQEEQKAALREDIRVRDEIVRGLQAELHKKVGARDRMIDRLQKECQRLRSEHGEALHKARTEFDAELNERDRVIAQLSEELKGIQSGK